MYVKSPQTYVDPFTAGPYGGPADDRYNPYMYDSPSSDKHRYNRANIDPYATLTPSERLRGQQQVDGKNALRSRHDQQVAS